MKTMKISYLVRDEKAKRQFKDAMLPEDVGLSVGEYEADGGRLYFIDLVFEGDSVRGARVLASIRDSLPGGDNARLIHDDASAKFCERLYPCFSRFERGLREAVAVAMCAEQGNFDGKLLGQLERHLTLEGLYRELFIDDKFAAAAKSLLNKKGVALNRERLKASLESFEERLLWDVLFNDGDMPTLRKCRDEIKDRRNDVMHHHLMTNAAYGDTRRLIKVVNNEIDEYLSKARSDVTYPKQQAAKAKVAAGILGERLMEACRGLYKSYDALSQVDFDGIADDLSRLSVLSVDEGSLQSISRLLEGMATIGVRDTLELGKIASEVAAGLDIPRVVDGVFPPKNKALLGKSATYGDSGVEGCNG